MSMLEAARVGDLFITVTGDVSVIRGEHFAVMKDHAIVCNSGHFNVELDLEELKELATGTANIKENVDEYRMADGRTLYVLAEGRLINLSAAFGHPPEVMDMSFANQALCVRYIVENHAGLKNTVHPVPTAIDKRVAALKLAAIGIEIEQLTAEQEAYLHSWTLGT
jgi:adenosylhomocysteinase